MLKNYYKPTQSYVICCNSIEKTSQRQLLAMMHLFTPILKQLILNAEKFLDQAQNHRRHSEILKRFATALTQYLYQMITIYLQQ